MKKQNNIEVIHSETVKPQTHTWKNFGMNVTAIIHVVCELIHNAYAACLSSVNKKIYVDIRVEDGDTFLYVKNPGNPADLKRVLDYGNRSTASSKSRTILNQNGTGFKTAASFLNPSNNGWAFYTRNGNQCMFVEAPYSETMEIKTISNWPFEDDVVSVVRIKVDNPQMLDALKASDIGYHYSIAIEKDNLEIYFNGEKVKPVMPKGAANSYSKVVDIQGNPVEFNYTTYQLGYDQKDEEYYAMGQSDQGVYLFVNHCLSMKTGLSLIKKKNGTSNMKPTHPSANGMIAIIDIIPPTNRSCDVPFTNTKNNIDFQKGTVGELYANAINDLVGDFFRSRYENETEAGRRQLLDNATSSILSGIAHYNMEYEISKELKADAVIGMKIDKKGKIDPTSVVKIIEFKKGKITSHHIGQAMSYYHALVRKFEETNEQKPAKERIPFDEINLHFNPEIVMVGQTLLPEAKYRMEREMKAYGMNIKFIPTNKMVAI